MRSETEDDLVRRWWGLAAAAAARYCRPRRLCPADRDDVLSDALAGLLAGLRTHRPEAGPLRPWLWLKAVRAIVDGVRSREGRRRPGVRRRQRPLSLDARSRGEADDRAGRLAAVLAGATAVRDREPGWLGDEEAVAVLDRLGLSGRLRRVLTECVILGRPRAEVAAELGVCKTRVSQCLTEALREARGRATADGCDRGGAV